MKPERKCDRQLRWMGADFVFHPIDRHYLYPDFEKDIRAAMEKYHGWLEEEIANVTHLVTQEANSA